MVSARPGQSVVMLPWMHPQISHLGFRQRQIVLGGVIWWVVCPTKCPAVPGRDKGKNSGGVLSPFCPAVKSAPNVPLSRLRDMLDVPLCGIIPTPPLSSDLVAKLSYLPCLQSHVRRDNRRRGGMLSFLPHLFRLELPGHRTCPATRTPGH